MESFCAEKCHKNNGAWKIPIILYHTKVVCDEASMVNIPRE